MRNPCKDCIYYNKVNKTCQLKKCAAYGDGKVSLIDILFCSPALKYSSLAALISFIFFLAIIFLILLACGTS